MVRLEKILYEKAFNNKLLGRARRIVKPVKMDIDSNLWLRQLPTNKYLAGFMDKFFSIFHILQYRHFREICMQRGLSFEDVLVQKENMVRRDQHHEHIIRETTHPIYF